MRTIEDFAAELITELDVTKGIDFLVGVKVRHSHLGEGKIVGVNNDFDLCRVEFTKNERWMELFIDEFAIQNCGWDFDVRKFDQIFGPHMVKSKKALSIEGSANDEY
jgi:hypothetical protein